MTIIQYNFFIFVIPFPNVISLPNMTYTKHFLLKLLGSFSSCVTLLLTFIFSIFLVRVGARLV